MTHPGIGIITGIEREKKHNSNLRLGEKTTLYVESSTSVAPFLSRAPLFGSLARI